MTTLPAPLNHSKDVELHLMMLLRKVALLVAINGFGAFIRLTFLAETREYYANKGDYFNTNEEMIEKFYSDQTWNNMNTVALANNVDEAFSADGRQRQLMIRMIDVHDSLPNPIRKMGAAWRVLGQHLALPVSSATSSALEQAQCSCS